MSTTLRSEFEEIWDDFVRQLNDFHERAAVRARRDSDLTLHEVFRKNRIVPKRKLQHLLRSHEGEKVNVGSATGLFFEQMAASLIEPALREEVAGITTERNAATHHPTLRKVSEQPDLLVTDADGERAVVFEFKAAPKQSDLSSVRSQRQQYMDSDVPVQFYLVGGHVSRNKEALADYLEGGWATFLNASDANKPVLESSPKLDDLVDEAAQLLI